MGHLENLKTSRDPTLGLELLIHAKNALTNHVSQSFFQKDTFRWALLTSYNIVGKMYGFYRYCITNRSVTILCRV
jgi:hypothetical protein